VDSKGHIATAWHNDSLLERYADFEEAQANARLIAAAPDLLAACEAVSIEYDGWPDDERIFLDMVREAIKKAKGK
jgi:hypothetical protein